MTTKIQGEFLAPGIISDQTQVSAASADHVLIFDASDNSLKKALVSTITDSGTTAADDITAGDAAVTISTTSGDITIDNGSSDDDIIFKGTDGGSDITALRLDMSSEGGATFNGNITLHDNKGVYFGAGSDLIISSDGTDATLDASGRINLSADDNGEIRLFDGSSMYGQFKDDSDRLRIESLISDADMLFVGNDGGSEVTALTLDMSEGGTATFNGNVGIGSTPPTTIRNDIHETEHALQVGRAAMLFSDTGLTTDLQNNSHLNNSNERIAMSGTLGGTLYAQYNGAHTWYTAAAVAAPNVQSMTARMSLDISGNLVVNQNVTAYGTPSDIKLKENIKVIDNPLDKVKQLKGITYDLKSDGNRLTGLIAQDLEKVLPEAVYTTKTIANEKEGEVAEEHLAIRYGNTVGLLVEAIKELEARVKELESK